VNGEYCIQRTDIVEEITKVLLEWGSIAKNYFLVSSEIIHNYDSVFNHFIFSNFRPQIPIFQKFGEK